MLDQEANEFIVPFSERQILRFGVNRGGGGGQIGCHFAGEIFKAYMIIVVLCLEFH